MTASVHPARPEPVQGHDVPHLVIVVNSDFFFLSHRLPIALEARRQGWDVTVVVPDTGRAAEIRAHGLHVIDFPLSRSGTNPWREARSLAFLRRTYTALRPTVVHHVTSKPVVYGSLAATGLRGTAVVNAVTGLGYTFIQKGPNSPFRRLVEAMYRVALRGGRRWTVFQNDDDAALFAGLGIVRPDRSVLIRGSGVDTADFAASDEPGGVPVVLLPARLLWDKGVGEFVEAARRLRAENVEARFVLVGKLDPGNPAAVPEAELHEWLREGVVEWWGYRTDMPAVLRQATVVALPSYREGLPKGMLEAGAAARARITTDVPGCRDTVSDGTTGLLVAVRDAGALAEAVRRLLGDRPLRDRLRLAARRDVEERHAVEQIVAAHMALYRRAAAGTAVPARAA